MAGQREVLRRYRRQMTLGDGIDTSAISATHENGVLTGDHPGGRTGSPAQDRSRHGGGQKSIETTTVDSDSDPAAAVQPEPSGWTAPRPLMSRIE